MRTTPATLNYDVTGATITSCTVNSYTGATPNGARIVIISTGAATNAVVNLAAANYFEADAEL